MFTVLSNGLSGTLKCIVSLHDLKMIPLVFQRFVVWKDGSEPWVPDITVLKTFQDIFLDCKISDCSFVRVPLLKQYSAVQLVTRTTCEATAGTPCSFLSSSVQERCGHTGNSLENSQLLSKEGWDLDWLFWWREGLGNLVHVYKYLMGGCEENGVKPFSVVSSDRAMGNGHHWSSYTCYLPSCRFPWSETMSSIWMWGNIF